MTKPTHKLRLVADLVYDGIMWHNGDDPEEQARFNAHLLEGRCFLLHCNDIGDTIGKLDILSIEEVSPEQASKDHDRLLMAKEMLLHRFHRSYDLENPDATNALYEEIGALELAEAIVARELKG